jgi:aldose sugar dehydrogenase
MIAIVIVILFLVSLTLSLGPHLGLFIVQAQPLNATETLGNLTDENHHWKHFDTDVTQSNGNLTIVETSSLSLINNNTQKVFHRAFLQTQLNTSTNAPSVLTLDYASKPLFYPPAAGKPIFILEIRDVKSNKILWSTFLNETSGKLLNDAFILPSNVLNKPIEFRLYIITEGGPSHSSLSLKDLYVNGGPKITDPNIKVEVLLKGLKSPTSMAFLGPNDLLVLEKNEGVVKRVSNGVIQNEPLLDVPVANGGERGMLGIAVKKTNTGLVHVFLYFTESGKDGDDVSEKKIPLGNRLYRYDLVDYKLVNPKLLLDLPSSGPCCNHYGGKIAIGPDNNVYTVIGDITAHRTKAQNVKSGKDPDGTSAIYRITQDGKAVSPTILGDKKPLNLYYAYGIRNSFGLDFDPVTGTLWDTENSYLLGDEINLVKPGFNSGWVQVQGKWNTTESPHPNSVGEKESGLVVLGKGKYSDPEFTWSYGGVGPTAVKFFNSTKFGKQYENEMFVGDFHNGYLYHFDLSKERNKLILHGPLRDKVADNITESQKAIFGQGFGEITDIQVGPDGYLYVLTYQGTIFRLVPST